MFRIFLLMLLPIFSFGQNILVSGYIRDGNTNAPVANAAVRLFMGGELGELKTITAEDGYYVFKSTQKAIDKNYSFTIIIEGYQRLSGVIKLNFGLSPTRDYNIYKSKEEPKIAETKTEITDLTENNKENTPSLLGAPINNLTFLIDVSGSMSEENRLTNLKQCLLFLIQQYRIEDKITIITYSSYFKVLLEAGNISELNKIEKIIKNLSAGGQSEGTQALKKSYDLAVTNYKPEGNNKIILATDGFFGIDEKSRNQIEALIAKGLGQNIKLSIFSFGEKDQETEERLKSWCQIGSGNYTNITSLKTAKDQVIEEARGK